MNEPYDLIQTVQLTEKASLLSEKLNKYVFRVNPRANKIQIKQAIEPLQEEGRGREHLQLCRARKSANGALILAAKRTGKKRS